MSRLDGMGLLASVGWLALLAVSPEGAFDGWLLAFVVVGSPLIGAVVLMLINRLTGGRWLAPVSAVAGASPAIVLLALPMLASVALVFPWARVGGGSPWLNTVAFTLRGGLGAVAYAVLAVVLRQGRVDAPRAGVALTLHGVLVTLLAVDWLFSLRPGWASGAAGLNMAAQQLASGAAVAALVAHRAGEDGAAVDLRLLAFGSAASVAYLAFMDYLIAWYGDLPTQVAWYAPRVEGAWAWAPVAALFVFAAGVLASAFRRGWRVPAMSVGVLGGLTLYQIWLLAPALPWVAIPAGLAATTAAAAALLHWRRRPAMEASR